MSETRESEGLEWGLKVHFSSSTANLYHVGYISIELAQAYSLARLIEDDNGNAVETYLSEPFRGYRRSSSDLTRYGPSLIISSASSGSLDLDISGTGFGQLVLAIIAQRVATHLDGKDRTFEIAADDKLVERQLKLYGEGKYGTGSDALNKLFTEVNRRNYSVEVKAKDVYLIVKIVDRYSPRIVKIIKAPGWL